jgi:hypothetical protein
MSGANSFAVTIWVAADVTGGDEVEFMPEEWCQCLHVIKRTCTKCAVHLLTVSMQTKALSALATIRKATGMTARDFGAAGMIVRMEQQYAHGGPP